MIHAIFLEMYTLKTGTCFQCNTQYSKQPHYCCITAVIPVSMHTRRHMASCNYHANIQCIFSLFIQWQNREDSRRCCPHT